MAARLALTGAAFSAAPAALKALNAATGMDLDGTEKVDRHTLEQRKIAAHKSHFGSPSLGNDSRPYV